MTEANTSTETDAPVRVPLVSFTDKAERADSRPGLRASRRGGKASGKPSKAQRTQAFVEAACRLIGERDDANLLVVQTSFGATRSYAIVEADSESLVDADTLKVVDSSPYWAEVCSLLVEMLGDDVDLIEVSK